MKKGFTLIELLGVIVLLSIIMVLIMPNIINSIKKANKDKDNYTASIIYKAMDSYILNNDLFKEEEGNSYCVSLNTLVNLGLIQSPVSYNDDESVEDTMSVKAVYNSQWNYAIISNSTCTDGVVKICSRTTSSTVTNGFIPDGSYSIGDEYTCNLGNNLNYHFYILNVNGNKVSLIAKNNLSNAGVLANGTTSKWYSSASNVIGPVTAYTFISTNTSNWSNIYSIKSFNFIDGNKDCESCGYNGIYIRKSDDDYVTSIINKTGSNKVTFNNIKARMPLLNEMTNIGCTTTNNSCPEWLGGGFYLNDSYDSSLDSVYNISSNRSITYTTSNIAGGIRPVIELYKSDLE